LDYLDVSWLDVIAKAPLHLYKMIFESPNGKHYQNYIQKEGKFEFGQYFREEKTLVTQHAAVYHATKVDLFNNVLHEILRQQSRGKDVEMMDYDAMTKFVAEQFLGILVYMDSILRDELVDRKYKEMTLESIGSLLRFIGNNYASDFCFKVMGLLKSTGNLPFNGMLKQTYLNIWSVLVQNCNPQAVGPFLSGIFVALESYIADFPEEVEKIGYYLLRENQSVLGKHLADLFFIDRTNYPDDIKDHICFLIQSQCITTGSDFETKLKRIIKHMKSESADSDVKNYCLQYLLEYSKTNRSKINELIYEPKKNEVKISDVLCVLLNCCRNKSSKLLLVQAAMCLGEIGALKPDFRIEDEFKPTDIGFTAHSDEFAIHALNLLCKDYKDLHQSDHMEFTAASIQGILSERKMAPFDTDSIYKKLSSTNQKVRNLFILTLILIKLSNT
jgi:serine/threonine-protein kinase ATR